MHHHYHIICGNASHLEYLAPSTWLMLGGDNCGGDCSGLSKGIDDLVRSYHDGGKNGEVTHHCEHLVVVS
jgi:hypothetical protein